MPSTALSAVVFTQDARSATAMGERLFAVSFASSVAAFVDVVVAVGISSLSRNN